MSRWLFLPNSVIPDLELLAKLSTEQVEKLRDILESSGGAARYTLFLRIAEVLSIPDQDAASLYSFWDYVQDERIDNQKTGPDAVSEFAAFLKSNPLGEGTSKAGGLSQIAKQLLEKRLPLGRLFGDLPNRERANKIQSLGSGPLPHLANVRTYCDLRPIYDKTATTITDFVASITLRIRTHAVIGSTEDYKEMFVQMSEDQVAILEAEIQRLRRKLDGLRKRFPELLPEQKKKSKSKGA
jgi:hypothetical protein